MTLRPERNIPGKPQRDYVPLTFTLPDGQRILIAMFLPPGVRPHQPTLACGYDNGFGHRWGPPIHSDDH